MPAYLNEASDKHNIMLKDFSKSEAKDKLCTFVVWLLWFNRLRGHLL